MAFLTLMHQRPIAPLPPVETPKSASRIAQCTWTGAVRPLLPIRWRATGLEESDFHVAVPHVVIKQGVFFRATTLADPMGTPHTDTHKHTHCDCSHFPPGPALWHWMVLQGRVAQGTGSVEEGPQELGIVRSWGEGPECPVWWMVDEESRGLWGLPTLTSQQS